MSTVKVRVVVEEVLRYDQTVEMTQEDFEQWDQAMEDGTPDIDTEVRDLLDPCAVICLECDVQRFEIVEDEA